MAADARTRLTQMRKAAKRENLFTKGFEWIGSPRQSVSNPWRQGCLLERFHANGSRQLRSTTSIPGFLRSTWAFRSALVPVPRQGIPFLWLHDDSGCSRLNPGSVSHLSALADPRIGGAMRGTRKQLKLALVIVLLVALALFVPSLLYFTELALRELRLMWWLILLLAGAIWLLGRPGRKK
jgi:hypothetical protein